jgi:alpha-glucosidase (family GH31 glycosyl hydrolase)
MMRELEKRNVHLILHLNARNFFDLLDPAARADQWKRYLTVANDGVAGWWQDGGERGKVWDSNSLHGTLWAKFATEGMGKLGKHVPVIARAAGAGGHRYISPWGGDIPTTDKAITADLAFIRDAGLAGYASAGCDMGGFGGNRSEPLIIRRVANMFLVFPVIRPHGAGGSKPPWTVSKPAQDLWRYFCNLRYRLHPYLYSAAIEAHLTGRPILAPLAFDSQDDVKAWERDYDFLFGPDLLVAPVVDQGNEREVYLPAGRWTHYWSGRVHEGGSSVTVAAPLLQPEGLPLFVRSGAMLAMMPEMNWIYQHDPSPLTIDVYPPEKGSSQRILYDAAAPTSPVLQTALSCRRDGGTLEIGIAPYRTRCIALVHETAEPASVQEGTTDLPRHRTLAEFTAARSGWYLGPGAFPGSADRVALSIKPAAEAATEREQNIRIRYR